MSSATPAPSRSGSASGSASGSGSRNATSATNSTSISIPATAAAGGITIVQPPSTASVSYYKIAKDEYITFGWNLTSLYVTPSSLTMIASCSANGNTYPVGPTNSPYNTIPANATQVIWNPWEWEQIPGQTPFAEATYVLKIWDERGPGSTIKGGWMSPYSGTQFSMYRPAQYQSIGDGWKCSTCNAAMTQLGEPASLAFMVTFAALFFSMWNIWRR